MHSHRDRSVKQSLLGVFNNNNNRLEAHN